MSPQESTQAEAGPSRPHTPSTPSATRPARSGKRSDDPSRSRNRSKNAKSANASANALPLPNLPPGCSVGPEYVFDSEGQPQLYTPNPTSEEQCNEAKASSDSPGVGQSSAEGRIIWVDFPPGDEANPFNFSRGRKLAIVGVATYFTGLTAYATSSYAIGIPSMRADLGSTSIQGAAGLALYAWGFGIAPLALAPLSEEYGRKWTYIVAVMLFTVLHLLTALARNTGMLLIGRFLIGCAGSLGATLVGGTISDIYVPEERGFPMALFALMAMFFTGIGPIAMSWVEVRPDLGWRWIQWIEMIATGVYIPLVILILTETRAPVLIRRRAAKMRKEHAKIRAEEAAEQGSEKLSYDYRYTARSEVGKVKFASAIVTSLLRPLLFLILEPVVTFFSVWIALAWGVFYTQIQGLPYIMTNVYGFSTTQTGLVYISMCVGSLIGFGLNFVQDAIYRRKVRKHGVEARLYAAMTGGVTLFIGCMIYAFTVQPHIHWIAPAIAVTIIIASVITLYITGFVYLSECYGSYASSALAGMSFLRNAFGGAFAMFTDDMYRTLTPRWAIFLMGMVAGVLGIVPFIAYWKGPEIRARSRFSRVLMEEERLRVLQAEKEGKEWDAEMASRRVSIESSVDSLDGADRDVVDREEISAVGNVKERGTGQMGEWDDIERIREAREVSRLQ